MVEVPVTLTVPVEIAAGLADGSLVRYGSVVRDVAGQVVKHLDEVPARPGDDLQLVGSAISRAWRSGSGKTIVVTGSTVVLVTGAAVGIVAANRFRLRRRIDVLNSALLCYLSAAQNGSLTAEHVDQLMNAVARAKEISGGESVQVAEEVIHLVESFSDQLADLHHFPRAAACEDEAVPIRRLEASLEAQREILRRVA